MSVEKINIKEFLDKDEKKDLLRLLTAGSVDDGKSTLIGRLLFDSKKLYEDQLDALERDSKRLGNAGGEIDYALLLDGLKAEREQGITIDVAYRYFSTNRRKFIIADTPGHEQYTRNMITGGSTANLAIILVDARTGVITQTKRHTFIVSLLGIKHVVLAVNKMDLVGYSQQVFDNIVSNYMEFAKGLNIPDIRPIPLSALKGDNVVEVSELMPWYQGHSLLEFLETVRVGKDRNYTDFRFPVQYVLRPNLDFRGFSGKVASGIIRQGDTIMALPSGKQSRVKTIHTYDGNLQEAFPPQSITITLEDEIDISRGEMIVLPDNLPTVNRHFDAMLVWMDEQPMKPGQQYFIKHTTNTLRAQIDDIDYRIDINTLNQSKIDYFQLNEIGRVKVTTSQPLLFDPYTQNRSTGAFILIDPITNNTSAVGMIIGKTASAREELELSHEERSKVATGQSLISSKQRFERTGQIGKTIIVEGDAKRRELAYLLERNLFNEGRTALLLDGASTPAISTNASQLAALCSSISSQAVTVIVYLPSDQNLADTLALLLPAEQRTYFPANQSIDDQMLKEIL